MTSDRHNSGPGLVLRSVRLEDGSTSDVGLRDGLIAEVAPSGGLSASYVKYVDLSGYLLLPAAAEPHIHLDTAMLGESLAVAPGDLVGGIAAMLEYQARRPPADFVARAERAALRVVANGATAIRSHVGIYKATGLRAVDALLELRDRLNGLVDLQLVALTLTLTGRSNAATRDMMRTAIEKGVDVVGGVPHLDDDPIAYHEFVFDLASEFGVPVDLHTDETVDPNVLWLPHLADAAASRAFAHGVVASHCVSLGVQELEHARAIAQRVGDAGVAVICNPQTNLFLQGRESKVAMPRGLAPLRLLKDAGVLVAAGSDNMRDPLNALGRGDPLEVASLLVAAGHLTVTEAYEAVSSGARSVMGLPEVKIEPGYPAELLALRASSLADALASTPARVTIHRGHVIARTGVDVAYPERRNG
jgi:cytosine/creatinine deaminase